MIIEKVICDYLTDKLGCKVLPEKPERPFGQMVFVEKTSENGNRFLYECTIAVQSYDESMYKAALLNEKVIEAMYGLVKDDNICKVTLNSDYNFTDTTTKEYRYQAVFDIAHY